MVPAQFVARKVPHAGSTVYPNHVTRTRTPIIDQGDGANGFDGVRESDVALVGKVKTDPGVHVNVFTNVRGIQSIAQKVWGTVYTKVTYPRGTNTAQGRQDVAIGEAVNVNAPEPLTYGEFATFDTNSRQRIRTALR